MPASSPRKDPAQVVIFGASGDLTLHKLMTALASLAGKDRPSGGFSVIGVSRTPKTDEDYRRETLGQEDLA